MKREYLIARESPASPWFYGYVRSKKTLFWGEWRLVCCGEQDREAVERKIDQYESEQPDKYYYTPKAPA